MFTFGALLRALLDAAILSGVAKWFSEESQDYGKMLVIAVTSAVAGTFGIFVGALAMGLIGAELLGLIFGALLIGSLIQAAVVAGMLMWYVNAETTFALVVTGVFFAIKVPATIVLMYFLPIFR